MSSIPEALLYTKEHEWVSATENIYTIGITDYAQAALGDIVYVQLPKVGDLTIAGTICGEIESTKSVSEIFAPLTGVVKTVNESLSNAPELINSDPYGTGWLVTIEINDPPNELLTAAQYAEITA